MVLNDELRPMKRLLTILPFLFLLGCQDPEPNDGYEAGYDLTCGFSWSGGNGFVLEKEYAYNFFAGARACAQEHPERVRQVLGLAGNGQTSPTTKSDARMEPAPEKPLEQQELLPSASLQTETVKALTEPAKSPVKTKAVVQSRPPKKPQTAAKTKTPAKAETPSNEKAPAKPKAPAKSKAPAKPKVPAKPKAPAKPIAPVKAEVPVKVEAPPKADAPPVPDGPKRQARQKRTIDTYESFMGE